MIHPSIQANIDYWMQFGEKLRANPPSHLSYYVVTEEGEPRAYAVRWKGANLINCDVFVPPNESQLIKEATEKCALVHGYLTEEPLTTPDGRPLVVDCYVYDSPIRHEKEWQVSFGRCLMEYGVKYPI